MTFAPPVTTALVIDAPEPGSRASSSTTFAPLVMQSSACERIFCGSPWAFTMLAVTPAFLKAAASSGASNRV